MYLNAVAVVVDAAIHVKMSKRRIGRKAGHSSRLIK